jgi:hypothetical protein
MVKIGLRNQMVAIEGLKAKDFERIVLMGCFYEIQRSASDKRQLVNQ